jgi:hypothetical protein
MLYGNRDNGVGSFAREVEPKEGESECAGSLVGGYACIYAIFREEGVR